MNVHNSAWISEVHTSVLVNLTINSALMESRAIVRHCYNYIRPLFWLPFASSFVCLCVSLWMDFRQILRIRTLWIRLELITDRVGGGGNAIGRVRPFVCVFWTNWPLPRFLHVCGSWLELAGSKSQGHRSKSKVTANAERVSTAASCEYWLMAVVVGFNCDVISCQLAWQGVQHRAAEASRSGGDLRMRVW